MKLSLVILDKLQSLDTNSRGKFYGHKLSTELRLAESFSARIERDGDCIVYLFPDRSRLRVQDSEQRQGKAQFAILSNVG
jgi:hypothetical protein